MKALSILCHPDDAEFMCAGTLALLKQRNWDIYIATMTPGDCGSDKLSREEISEIRRKECANSAAILDGKYYCCENEDVFISYDKPTLLSVIEVMRKVKPDLVFTASPQDYFIDHENTSRVAETACFACGMKNVETDSPPCDKVPYLYYVDAMEGKDRFGKPVEPTMCVDISQVIETKEKMLCCHESQRAWLMAHHGMDEYVHMMKRFAEKRGKKINTEYAEGFRQHLGHGYPQDDILKEQLKELAVMIGE